MPYRRQWKSAQPDSPRNTIGAPTRPMTALTWRDCWRAAACSGVVAASTLCERHGQRAVEVGILQVRQHVVVEDRLALAVRQERLLETGTGIQLDLAVLEIRLHVEEDHQAVVEALASDAPLVHQGTRLGVGLVGRRVFAAVLGVDDDLRAGPRLDRVDRLFRRGDGRRRQDAGVVVDRAVDLGLREGRAGWRRRADGAGHQEREADDRQDGGEAAHRAQDSGLHAPAARLERASRRPPSVSRKTWGARGRPL